MISFLRLSPSGPFLKDGTSGVALQVGSDGTAGMGSAGLVWRQLGGVDPVDTEPLATVLDSGDAGLYAPVGYRYELAGEFYGGIAGSYTIAFEYSVNDGVSWNTIGYHYAGVPVATYRVVAIGAAGYANVRIVGFDATALVLAAGAPGIRFRMRAQGGVGTTAATAAMRIEQYVT